MKNEEFTVGQIHAVECYKEGWAIIKDEYWLMFAITLVGLLIGGFTFYILLGAMVCGIFLCFLQKIDTGKVSFENLWKGLNYFLPSLIVMLIAVVPTIIVYAIIYLPLVMTATMGDKISQDEFAGLMLGSAAVDFVVVLIIVCFHTLILFAFPLIVDRKLPAFSALKLSIKAIWKNLGGFVGIIGVYFVLSILGALACGIGVYFMLPIMFAGFAVAYRKVFPAQNNVNFNPPPPNVYQGL